MQSNAIELNLGTALEFHLPDNASSDKFASLGTYFRWRDAIVFVAGFGYLNYRMGISYDVNISSLNATVVPSDLIKTYLSSSNGKKDSFVPAASAEVS